MKGVTFGTYHSYDDFSLILNSKDIAAPKTKTVKIDVEGAEGELAFLLDSVQRPYDYFGTISGFLNLLIDNHNAQVEEAKWFTVGNVTVADPNDYIVRSNIDYVDIWTELQKKLIDLLGGYIVIRHEGYINYIDYLQDFTLFSPQKITFGKNLLDLKRIRKGADIATALHGLTLQTTHGYQSIFHS